METTTTTDTSGANLKVVIGIDVKTAAYIGAAIFIGIVLALIVYKNI